MQALRADLLLHACLAAAGVATVRPTLGTTLAMLALVVACALWERGQWLLNRRAQRHGEAQPHQVAWDDVLAGISGGTVACVAQWLVESI